MQSRSGVHKPLYTHLYFQVLVAIVIGVMLGWFDPSLAAAMKPFGDGFIRLIKMMIAPIIFTTVVVGIAKIGDMKKVGRVGLKALIYFELVTTLALAIGLVVVNVVRPGVGINADVNTLDTKGIAAYTAGGRPLSTVDLLLHIIPDSAVGAFASGEILQVLTFSVLFGLALGRFGDKGSALLDLLEQLSHVLFDVIAIIMRFAPIGAFGAMAFTIGKYGVGTLRLAGHADALRLCHMLSLRLRRAGPDRPPHGLQPLAVPALHQGGNPDRAGDVVIGGGLAADDHQVGERRLRQVGRGAGDPDRILVQPGWHLDLPDDGGGFHRPGHQRSLEHRRAARHPRRAPIDVQGSRGRDRRRVHHAGRTQSSPPERCLSPAWRCCWGSTDSCRRPGRSRT